MSTPALVILLDLYAIGALLVWLRGVRRLPEPARPAEIAADVIVVTMWPLCALLVLVRALVVLIFYVDPS